MLLAATVLLLSILPQGPKTFWTYDPVRETYANPSENFALWLVNIGDFDGDGAADLAASSSHALGPGVWLISGRTGSIIKSFGPPLHSVDERTLDVVDDADGDGRDDVVILSSNGVSVLSTATGAVIWLLSHSALSICSVTDIDLDQRRDILVTHDDYADPETFSGRTGLRLRTYPLPWDHGRNFGYQLDDAGDVDGDGSGDFVISPRDRGRPVIYSGRTAQILVRIPVEGCRVAGVGDWDLDGYDDLAYQHSWDPIQIVSARTGATICSMGNGVTRLTDVPDMDGDGLRDLFAGDSEGSLGNYSLIGSRWKRIFHERDGLPGENIGLSMALLDDLNSDGKPDYALGCGQAASAGRIEFEASRRQPMLSVSRGAVSASAGEPFTLYLRFPPHALAGEYRILASLAPGSMQRFGVTVPLGYGPMLAMTMRGEYPPMFYRPQGYLSQQRQDASCDVIPLPGELVPLIGRTLHFAAVTFAANPWNGLEEVGFVSSAVSVRIQP